MTCATGSRIRQVDPAAERERILAVLSANLPAAAGRARFDWLYLNNPDGPALVWLAENENGQAVGTSAAHPRRMRVAGETVRALVLGDFAFDAAQRSIGPALHLLRATLAPVRDGTYPFSFDFPSRALNAVYRRMGAAALGDNQRWMHPVAVQRLLRARLGDTPLADVLGVLGDTILRGRRSLRGTSVDLQVEPLACECSEEFAALDAGISADRVAASVRDAAYLNWHYLQNPIWKHAIFTARAGGRLAGYTVLRRANPRVVSVVDLQGQNEDICAALLSAALDHSRAQDAAALHVEVLAHSPAARLVETLGFFRRETSVGPVLFLSPDCPHATKLQSATSWWLMGGDRDV